MEIRGKVAFITGAASGIGRATAVMLAEKGARAVVIADLDDDGLAETAGMVEAKGSKALAVTLNVTDRADLERAYAAINDTFGQLDIVFNNAGIVSGPPPYPDTDLDRITRVVEIDLLSVILSSTLAIRIMREQGGGVIINTASTGGLNPYLADAPYAASKAGVIMFSRSCGDLAASDNIRVNAVCPAVTETPILEKTGGGTRPEWLGPILQNIRLLKPEDIGQRVIELIEDDSMAGEFSVVANEPAQGSA